MKKILTALLAAFALCVSAQTTFSGSTLYGYCTNATIATGLNVKATMGVAMQLNQTTINRFSGCKITAIAIANGKSDDPSVMSVPLSLFVGETLADDPIQTFTGEMDLTQPMAYKEYALTEPITITKETPELFFGYSVDCEPTKYNPLVTDGTVDTSAGPGDYIGQVRNGAWVWQQMRQQVGMPCIRIKIEGEDLIANAVSIIEHHLPTYAAPGSNLQPGIYVRNLAYNTVKSLTVNYSTNGVERSETVTLPSPLLYNDYAGPLAFTMEFGTEEGNDLPVSVEISGLNGDAANNATANTRTAAGTFLCLAEGYDKAMVVEEATATWCGFCPRGLVGMAAMYKAHENDGRFIPIAAHYNDRLSVQSYSSLFGYTYGIDYLTPNCVVNRNTEQFGAQDPAQDFLEEAYKLVTAEPAVCSVNIKNFTFDAAKRTITVDAEAEFAIPTSGEYGFCYVLTEDNVGPYDQTNYFSPSAGYGASLEWWDTQSNPVEGVYYDHIARYIYPFLGLKGSLPDNIAADTKYSHTASLQTNKVSDINNCNIIVMVVNRASKRIENAVMKHYSDGASIEEVAGRQHRADNEYYDLQGRRVTNPGHGLYIRNGRKIYL